MPGLNEANTSFSCPYSAWLSNPSVRRVKNDGENAVYLTARIKRDHKDIWRQMKKGKFSSVGQQRLPRDHQADGFPALSYL